MPRSDKMYIANLAFLLNYDEGRTDEEIQYEIFKAAFQDKEVVHYDRALGGNFRDLEQEPSNISTVLWFISNFIESIFFVNSEKNFDPYIVIGYEDIKIIADDTGDIVSYLTEITYRLLTEANEIGTVQL